MSTNDLQANSDLLFCPFCGGEAHIKEVVSACEKRYTVGCSDSGCEVMLRAGAWHALYMGDINFCPNCGARVTKEVSDDADR